MDALSANLRMESRETPTVVGLNCGLHRYNGLMGIPDSASGSQVARLPVVATPHSLGTSHPDREDRGHIVRPFRYRQRFQKATE